MASDYYRVTDWRTRAESLGHAVGLVVVAFLPHALLGSPTAAFALQTALNVAAAIGIALVVLRALDRRGVALGRADRVLVAAFTIASSWSAAQFVMGQVNLPLAVGIAIGLDWLDRSFPDRSPGDERSGSDQAGTFEARAGVVFGLVALVKLFPATIGLWLLRTRRDRAVVAAIATGLGGLVLGAIVFGPDLTLQYLTEVLVDRFEGQTFEGTPDPERNHTTARRMLAAAFGGSSVLVTPLAFALVVPPVAYCYRRIDSDARRLSAILATLVGTLLVMPLQPLYFSFLFLPVVVLAVGLEALERSAAPGTFLSPWTLAVDLGGEIVVATAGGLLVGVVAGYVVFRVAAVFEDDRTTLILSFVLVYGAYLLGEELGVSGVVAVVGAGLFAAEPRRSPTFDPSKRLAFRTTWAAIAFVANTFLFLVVGIKTPFDDLVTYEGPTFLAILLVFLARAAVVYPLSELLNRGPFEPIPRSFQHVLVWSGIHVSIPLALVLGLPPEFPAGLAEQLRTMVFGVAAFTLVVQGLSMATVVDRLGLVAESTVD